MISIIICCRTEHLPIEIEENIMSTIGVECELIIIDNSRNLKSIFSAYNEGRKMAKGNILCFMHDDILFHTNLWGRMVEEYFNKNIQVGMLGVIGSHYMPKTPAAWWDAEVISGNVLQGEYVDNCYTTKTILHSKHKKDPTKVAVIDGFWMCIPSHMFNLVNWDESYIGFHGYDLDMSYQIWKSGFEVHILWGVLIEHKSIGVVEEPFLNASESVCKKWQHFLPICVGTNLSEGEEEARARLVEVKRELLTRHLKLKRTYASLSFRIGSKISRIFPFNFFNKINLQL